MLTKELIEGSYMEALLRSAILLGDLHRTTPVHEITISGFLIQNHARMLYPRCSIVTQTSLHSYPETAASCSSPGESYLVLYPIRKKLSA